MQRSAAAARDAVLLGSSVPVVLDTSAVPDIDGNNDNSKAAKLFLTVLKNDVSKLPGFEFGKDKSIGHLEELSPETEAFLLANGMGSSNDFLQLAWGTVKVTLTDDEILIYWSFSDDQTQYVMNIRGKYDGKLTSFNRIERNGDAYNSYFVNKNGDSYIPTEIALMDSTGGAV